MLLIRKIRFVFILIFFVVTSCTSDNNKVSCVDKGLYRVSVENLYDYYDEHDDSLVCGLSVINKETHYFGDNQHDVYLYMGIEDPNFHTGEPIRREFYFTKDETNRLSVFLDSCLVRIVPNGQYWEVKFNSNLAFSYCERDKYVNFWCNQGHLLFLQITPQKLKEILVKAKVDDW